MDLLPHARRRRVSVMVYLAGAFGVCLFALGAVMAMTTTSSFHRERDRAHVQLEAAAQAQAQTNLSTDGETTQFMQGIVEQATIRSLDATQCRTGMSALAGLLPAGENSYGYVRILRPDHSVVCSIGVPESVDNSLPVGDWFDKARTTKQVVDGGIAVDALTKKPAHLFAFPIDAFDGRTGVMEMVFNTEYQPITSPGVKGMVLIAVDPTRQLILSTTVNAPVKSGPVGDSWLRKALPAGAHARRDADGVERLYVEVAAANGWHILAGVPKTVALHAAETELRRNIWLGVLVLLLVGTLGFILERHLARPVRRLRRAIEAASSDTAVRAPVSGPAEVAALAEAFNDTIQERQDLEMQLSHQALHDVLTGLPNRALLADRLAQALERARRQPHQRLAVMFFDVDRFKVINDSYGHEHGDKVLVRVAQHMSNELRPGDTIARFGGDEFVVLAENVKSDAAAFDIARRLQEAAAQPLTFDNEDTQISVTVGIAFGNGDSSYADLLRDADAAMYRTKERGRGGVGVFDEELGEQARTRAQVEQSLRKAIDRGELVVQYQPEVSVETGLMTGCEALVRWMHPQRGMLPPAEFIPIAEESGLISEVGDVVLRAACKQLAEWRAAGIDITVSVNLAPRQLTDPTLPTRVKKVLAETGAPASNLVLEMTESALVEDDPRTIKVLKTLKSMGVHLALDDFGTGYASLSYLRHFPVDVVKIDQSFVGDLGRANGGSAIVAAVVAMGQSLGLKTVAEGVEQSSQLAELSRMGCNLAQGFYLSRPIDADLIAGLANRDLRRQRRKPARREAPVVYAEAAVAARS